MEWSTLVVSLEIKVYKSHIGMTLFLRKQVGVILNVFYI